MANTRTITFRERIEELLNEGKAREIPALLEGVTDLDSTLELTEPVRLDPYVTYSGSADTVYIESGSAVALDEQGRLVITDSGEDSAVIDIDRLLSDLRA